MQQPGDFSGNPAMIALEMAKKDPYLSRFEPDTASFESVADILEEYVTTDTTENS